MPRSRVHRGVGDHSAGIGLEVFSSSSQPGPRQAEARRGVHVLCPPARPRARRRGPSGSRGPDTPAAAGGRPGCRWRRLPACSGLVIEPNAARCPTVITAASDNARAMVSAPSPSSHDSATPRRRPAGPVMCQPRSMCAGEIALPIRSLRLAPGRERAQEHVPETVAWLAPAATGGDQAVPRTVARTDAPGWMTVARCVSSKSSRCAAVPVASAASRDARSRPARE